MDGVTITKVTALPDGRYKARVNGHDVEMLNACGGWIASDTRRELIPSLQAELNRKVRSDRRRDG